MTPEQYEAWRARQAKYPPVPKLPSALDEEPSESNDAVQMNDDATTSAAEMLDSLEQLLQDTKEAEKRFVDQMKEIKKAEKRRGNTAEESQRMDSFKEEKTRIEAQLRFVRKNL